MLALLVWLWCFVLNPHRRSTYSKSLFCMVKTYQSLSVRQRWSAVVSNKRPPHSSCQTDRAWQRKGVAFETGICHCVAAIVTFSTVPVTVHQVVSMIATLG